MLLKHMVDMAHSVGVKICIEGIEEKEELEHIMLLKPDYIQGFYYGRPVSLSVFMESYEYKTNKYVTYSFFNVSNIRLILLKQFCLYSKMIRLNDFFECLKSLIIILHFKFYFIIMMMVIFIFI